MDTHTIYASFEAQVRAAPGKPAVFDEQRTLTRAQLAALADTIAGRFPGACPFVGIVMDHGVEMIAAMLAVLKTGAAYVPVEPDFPVERIRYMMNECGVGLLITQQKYADKLAGFPLLFVETGAETAPDAVPVPHAATPESLAYILYTSGSTGSPKGVAVENRNVCHYVRAFCNEFAPGEGDIMLQNSVCSFDIFVEEVFPTLLAGAVLAIPSAETRDDFSALMAFIEARGVTMVSGFPYLLLRMNALATLPASLRLLISGGDVLRESYITNLLGRVAIYNTYGPSETTVCATYYKCNGGQALDDGTYPIGKAVLGVEVLLLGDHLQPVPAGEVGEICIAGGGVARGYLAGRERKAFATLPDGRRIYRSGDLGRLLPGGNLAFLRRKDTQVMILGRRVEPNEVENVLAGCAGVKQGVVRAFTDEQGLAYLVAYIVPAKKEFRLSALKSQLAQYLPPYMIPEAFVLLKEMPLTLNEKVDRRALPVVLKEGAL